MNRARRKNIYKVVEEINNLIGLLEETKENLEDIKSEEEEYYDNIPENLQNSINAENSLTAQDNLEEAIYKIDNAIDCLTDAISYCEEI